jgi:ribonuclease HII
LGKRPESKKSAEFARSRYEALDAFDREYADRGFAAIAGVDEVGRGALAGPVVSAAVVLPRGSGLVGVDDSKSLDPDRREEMFDRIVEASRSIAISFGHPDLIDRENILVATLMTMHRAVTALRVRPDVVLVDGRETFQWPGPMVAVKQGDASSLAIAAASIVAKVARDRAMCRLHARFPQYRFDRNKGYGTRDHIEAISRHGAASVHRRSFLLKIVEKTPSMF